MNNSTTCNQRRHALPVLSLLTFTLLISAQPAAQGQPDFPDDASRTYRSIIDWDLRTFDLPTFEYSGQPDRLNSRLGIYFNAIPADSVARLNGGKKENPWFVIWHVMPHWSADEGGVLIGDTLLAIDGHPIGDSLYYGEDFINRYVKGVKPGEKITLTLRRKGKKVDLKVPLKTGERIPVPFRMPSELGPVRQHSWLATTLEENGLSSWSDTIKKQMRGIADQDFSTVRFAGRPNPWRLNVVTALHHYPMRTGAYSRLIVGTLWDGVDAGSGLRPALDAAAHYLDVDPDVDYEQYPPLPTDLKGMTDYLDRIDAELERAYRPVRSRLEEMIHDLAFLLDPDENAEGILDTITDGGERKRRRNLEEERIAILFARADSVDLVRLLAGGELLAQMTDSVWLEGFAAMQFDYSGRNVIPVDGVEGTILYAWNTPAGICVIGGGGPNRYSGNVRLIIDVGGDDIYELPPLNPGHARVVADIAGNDLYTGNGQSQGAGIGGLDLLVDLAGDDTYRSDNFSQGAGLLGIGILADYAGNDLYRSHWASQGAGFLGIGLLYDRTGSDNYVGDIYAQGFGYAKGFGALLDDEGNDSYRAGWVYEDSRYPDRAHIAMSQGFGFGMRPWSTGIGTDGGIGVLSDRHGDDLYASDFFSQGGSYWYALGILHDGEGADRYTAGQYSQGSGIHLSFGALLDDAGDDMYDAYHGLEQGNAHDWSAGCLEDLGGNDTYRGSTASQGCALNVSFAWLLDRTGDDRYYILPADTVHSQGGGSYNNPREHGSLGLLLDFGSGNDVYTVPNVTPGLPIVKGERGVLFDGGK